MASYIFDKEKIKEQIDLEKVYELVNDWGGEPIYTTFGLLCSTICHNLPGEGSKKLYFYTNSQLFTCYTECASSFDIFELVIKVNKIQNNIDLDLNQAILYVAKRFGLTGEYDFDSSEIFSLEDWKIIARYEDTDFTYNNNFKQLKIYDSSILEKFNYISIKPWEKEGMTKEVLHNALIGYYPKGEQITIPHFDQYNNLIGLRGRALIKDEAERYGKYRPLKISGTLYTHPLSLNLYNLNFSKRNIKKTKKAIIFESEKSCLLFQSYFGFNNDISVACCGFNISEYQMELLLKLGVREVIIAFDKQFQEKEDREFKRLTNKLRKMHKKYKNYCVISFVFDKNDLIEYKDAPIDKGKEIFLNLLNNRIYL